jgi:ribosomal protein L11 methyltransferase
MRNRIQSAFALGPVNCSHKQNLSAKSMIFQSGRHRTTKVAMLETDEQSARRIVAIVAECGADERAAISVVDNGRGSARIAIHFAAPPDEEAVRALVAAAAGPAAAAALRFEHLATKDWVKTSLAGLKPVEAGRFIVHGAHDRACVAANRVGVEIEAALAFGTGHHGTTRGCLLALDRICKAFTSPSPCKGEVRGGGHAAQRARHTTPTRLARARRPPPFRGRNLKVLDLGTGSGVLAIAAARALRQRVLATDIDAAAVHVARANARLNRVRHLVRTVRADGIECRDIKVRAPFDLVFANILLGPLRRLATPLKKLMAPGARVILSGILTSQANAVLSVYRPLTLEQLIALDGWTTLVLRRAI